MQYTYPRILNRLPYIKCKRVPLDLTCAYCKTPHKSNASHPSMYVCKLCIEGGITGENRNQAYNMEGWGYVWNNYCRELWLAQVLIKLNYKFQYWQCNKLYIIFILILLPINNGSWRIVGIIIKIYIHLKCIIIYLYPKKPKNYCSIQEEFVDVEIIIIWINLKNTK